LAGTAAEADMNYGILILLAATPEPGAGGFNATPIVVATIAGIMGAIPGVLAWRASSKANALNSRKVDQDAYDKAVAFHSRLLDDANRQIDRVTGHLDRVTTQLDRVNEELAKEQSSNVILKGQIRALESTVQLLNDTINDLKARLAQRIDTV
jgi:septal ring factor EnvC (AmiA/AmiB activator)